VVWLMYAAIYHWPRTRLSEEAIDAVLTKAAWPLHRLRRRDREAGPAPSL